MSGPEKEKTVFVHRRVVCYDFRIYVAQLLFLLLLLLLFSALSLAYGRRKLTVISLVKKKCMRESLSVDDWGFLPHSVEVLLLLLRASFFWGCVTNTTGWGKSFLRSWKRGKKKKESVLQSLLCHTYVLGVERQVATYRSSLFGVFVRAFILACLGLTEGTFFRAREVRMCVGCLFCLCASKSVQCSVCTSPHALCFVVVIVTGLLWRSMQL